MCIELGSLKALGNVTTHKLRKCLGPYFKSHSCWVMRKGDKEVYHHFLSSWCLTPRCLSHILSWLKTWSLYCSYGYYVSNSHVLEISSSSLLVFFVCCLFFCFFVFAENTKIHVDLYFYFFALWEPKLRANFPWNKLKDYDLGTKKKWKEGKVYSNYHSLVFPTAMVTAVSKQLQRKEKCDIGKYSFFFSLERKWQSYWPQLTC